MTVATRNGFSVSRLKVRSVHIARARLVEIPDVSLVTRQES